MKHVKLKKVGAKALVMRPEFRIRVYRDRTKYHRKSAKEISTDG